MSSALPTTGTSAAAAAGIRLTHATAATASHDQQTRTVNTDNRQRRRPQSHLQHARHDNNNNSLVVDRHRLVKLVGLRTPAVSDPCYPFTSTLSSSLFRVERMLPSHLQPLARRFLSPLLFAVANVEHLLNQTKVYPLLVRLGIPSPLLFAPLTGYSVMLLRRLYGSAAEHVVNAVAILYPVICTLKTIENSSSDAITAAAAVAAAQQQHQRLLSQHQQLLQDKAAASEPSTAELLLAESSLSAASTPVLDSTHDYEQPDGVIASIPSNVLRELAAHVDAADILPISARQSSSSNPDASDSEETVASPSDGDYAIHEHGDSLVGLNEQTVYVPREAAASESSQKKWLSYWVFYALVKSIESTKYGEFIQRKIPYFNLIKMGFFLWAQHKSLNGATLLYDYMLSPFVPPPRVTISTVPKSASNLAGLHGYSNSAAYQMRSSSASPRSPQSPPPTLSSDDSAALAWQTD